MADSVLRIAVDGRELTGQMTGVGRYLWHVLREWTVGSPRGHALTVILPAAPSDEVRRAFPGVDWLVGGPAPGGTAWEQLRLPGLVRRSRADALFAVGYTAPLFTSCPFVVVIHDVSFIAHPEWFRWREGARRRWLTTASARRASRIITVSEFSAAEIVRCTGVARSNIELAPPGPPPDQAPPPASARAPVVLYVGSIFNRRRVPTLIEAFSRAAARVPNARLVLVGDDRTTPPLNLEAVVDAFEPRGRVEWRRYVSESELESLYAHARVFAFLSEYEGFAMTPMEAIAHGVPAILLDTPVAREVYGPGAQLVADDTAQIADALVSLLLDEVQHDATLAAGRARLQHFSWSDTANTIMDALERAARRL